MTREAEAHAARQRLDKAVTALLLTNGPGQLAAYREARDELYSLATMTDDEFDAAHVDGAPDTREQVTTPEGVWAR